ncbi:hypothetical protein [Nitrosospira briensis]|uniref:hypothetical protein n=1 Tax=Nitrosospira briensis TaxID=35799 RepID=UPI00055A8135|nr:hypothetical protein [Nitrosospira briensis]
MEHPEQGQRERDGGVAGWNARKAATRMVQPLRAGRRLPREGATPERDTGATSATATFPVLPDRRFALSLRQRFRGSRLDKAGYLQSHHPFAPLENEWQNRALTPLPILACQANHGLRRAPCDHADFCRNALPWGPV